MVLRRGIDFNNHIDPDIRFFFTFIIPYRRLTVKEKSEGLSGTKEAAFS
jgi:hypothetical protein